ncbi:MAG: RHS repeat-associated core domain-containing protein, partial [Clostridia bacterium]
MNKKVKIVLTILGILLMWFIGFSINNKVLANTEEVLPEYEVNGKIQSDTTWERGIYSINGDLIIYQNVTLTVKEGSILKIDNERSIKVEGNFVLNGTAENKIMIESKHENEYWINLYVGGKMQANYTNIKDLQGANAGGEDYFFDIYGYVYLDNVEIGNVKPNHEILMKGKELVIKNSVLDCEKVKIENYNKLDIQNNTINRFDIKELVNENYIIKDNTILSNEDNGIEIYWQGIANELKMYNNLRKGETRQLIQLTKGQFTCNATLSGNNNDYYFPNGMQVRDNVTLTIQEGVSLKIGKEKSVLIEGVLILNGTAENKIAIQSKNEDEYWINLYVGGKMQANYTNIKDLQGANAGGEDYFFDIYGYVYLDNVEIGNVKPNHEILMKGKELVIKNSVLDCEKVKIENYNKLDIQNNTINRFDIKELVNENYIIKDNTILSNEDNGIEIYWQGIANELKMYNNLRKGETRQLIQLTKGQFTCNAVLSGNNSDYYFPNGLQVRNDTILTVQEGVSLKIGKEKSVSVDGVLILNGTIENNISIQSKKEDEYWFNMSIGGKIQAIYTNIKDLQGDSSGNESDVLYLRGFAYFDNVKIDNVKPNQGIWIEGQEIIIKNSILDCEKVKINNYSKLDIQNNTLNKLYIKELVNENYLIKDNTILSDENNAIEVGWQGIVNELKMYNNLRQGQTKQLIQLTKGLIVTSMILPENSNYYFPNGIEIRQDVTLRVNEGSTLCIGKDKKIDIYGNFILNGTADNNVSVQSLNEGEYWNNIFASSSGTIELQYTNIKDFQGTHHEIYGLLDFRNVNIETDKEANFYINTRITNIENSTLPVNIIVTSNNSSITNSNIRNRTIEVKVSPSQDALVLIENNTLSNIKITNLPNQYVIRNNHLTDVAKTPLSIPTRYFNSNTLTYIYNNVLDGLDKQYVKLPVRDSLGDIYLTGDVDYYVEGCLSIPEGTTMIIDEGALLRLSAEGYVDVYGTLYVNGKIDKEVVITHENDSNYHGNGDTRYTKGMFIATTGQAYINNMILRYARGYHGSGSIENNGGLYLLNSQISNVDPTARGSIQYNSSKRNQVLKYNSLSKAIQVDNNMTIDATNNFWDNVTIEDTNKYIVNPKNETFIRNHETIAEFEKVRISEEMVHYGTPGVDSYTGNYSKQYDDLDLEIENISDGFKRTYNSKNLEINSLGQGWTLGFESKIECYEANENKVLVNLPTGQVILYEKIDNNTYMAVNSRNTLHLQDGAYIVTTKEQEKYIYDYETGKLTGILDKYGNRTQIQFNTKGQIDKVIDYAGRMYTINYNNAGKVEEIIDSLNRKVTYTYNEKGLLTSVTNVNSKKIDYQYDINGFLTSISENGNVIESANYVKTEYTPKLATITYATGKTENYIYNTSNTQIQDNNGNKITKYFDISGYETSIIYPNGDRENRTYSTIDGKNKYGEIISKTELGRGSTKYEYDDRGNVLTQINPDESQKHYEYNEKNSVIRYTDELNHVTEYVYDTDGITLLQEKKPLGETIQYTYSNGNIKGLVSKKIDGEGGSTFYEYDQYGNLVKTINPIGKKETFGYNILGWITSKVDANGNITTYEYQFGKPYKTIDSYGNAEITEYDVNGNLIKVVDRNGNVETREYDLAGNVIKIVDKLGNVTTYAYDIYGNKIKEVQPNGCIYTYTYDQLNRLVQMHMQETEAQASILLKSIEYDLTVYTNKVIEKTYLDAQNYRTSEKNYDYLGNILVENQDGCIKMYWYNAAGAKTSQKDANNGYTYYSYDEAGRLVKEAVMVAEDAYKVTTYAYDKAGRKIEEKMDKAYLNSADAPIGEKYTQIHYQYDAAGNKVKVSKWTGEEETYTYDNIGNVTKIMISFPEQEENKRSSIAYTYNKVGKIVEKIENGKQVLYEYDKNGNMTKQIEADGKNTIYTYDSLDRVIKKQEIKAEEEMITQNVYDNVGNIIESIDANGNSTHYAYNTLKHVIKETNSLGHNINYTVDWIGQVTSKRLQDGKSVIDYQYDKWGNKIAEKQRYDVSDFLDTIEKTYAYDKAGNLIKEVDGEGNQTTYAYDKLNRLTKVVDAQNHVVEKIYDVEDNLIEERNEQIIHKYSYDDMHNLLKETVVENKENAEEKVVKEYHYDYTNRYVFEIDAKGNWTRHTYNNQNEIIESYNHNNELIENYVYDVQGNRTKVSDNTGRARQYAYSLLNDELYEKLSMGDEKNIQYTYEYDKVGNIIKQIDGNGNITTYTYDAIGRQLTKTNALGQTTTYAYDEMGNRIKETDYLGNETSYTYDAFGRLHTTTNAYGQVIETLEYDKNDRQIKSIDALGHTLMYKYDSLDNLIEKVDQEGFLQKYEYDREGNVIKQIDKNGNATTYQYNVKNELIEVTDALSQKANYEYDANGNLVKKVDTRGNVTTSEYDAQNNEIKTIDGLSYFDEKMYNQRDELQTRKTKNEALIEYAYDNAGRLIKETIGDEIVEYVYDNNDNLLQTIVNGQIQTVREYDVLNRTITKKEYRDNKEFTFTYEYDIIESLEPGQYKEITTDPYKDKVEKVYDKVGRQLQVTNKGKTTTYTYYANGALEKTIYPNETVEQYTYYPDNTLKELVNKKADNTEISKYSYEYDNNNNVTKKIDELGETSYTYNALDMLLEVSKKQDGKKTVYAYDGAGNRTKETLTTNEGDKVIQYEYNQKNQLVKKIEADNSVTVYTYDHNGNEIQVQKNEEVITQNTYNAKNELIKTIENGIETTYQYDVLGNRIEKTSGGHTTKYFYEGNQVILELNEHNEQIAKNVYGINLIARSTPEQLGYYMYNGHGDVVQILDESSNLLNRYGYDEFGNIIAQEEQMDNPYQYAGYYYDKETKNYYLLNRYYNPEIARFISEDTYRGEINDPLSLNQYVYARSNPLRYNDPNGHFAIPVVTGFIGGVFSSGASIIGDLLAGNGIDWIKAGGAFVEGAIIGGSLGLAAPLGMPTLLGTAYLSGTLGNAVNQKIVTGEVDWWQANVNGLATAVGVGTFGINGDVTSKGVKWIQDYAIKGAVSSMASNTTSQLLTKNIRDFSFGEVALSGVVGAVMAPIGTKVTQVAIDKLGPSQYT